ncbi:MAG: radical SAM protein [Myxococcales bacterium]
MRLSLVGADFEENLGLGMIAATAQQAGHSVVVHPFNDVRQAREVARRIASARPELVGLSLQFQHRGHEFVALARALREAGYRGHLTCGGMLASAAWQQVLAEKAFDSVVLYEGEQTIVELAGALVAGRPLAEVPGLALRDERGEAVRTADRERPSDLDALPFPTRYRPPTRHLGIPFLPVLGSRGCWGRCTFCSISSFHLEASAHGGGQLFRRRSPENIAQEMALLAGDGPALFCFHDDNFLLPNPKHSLKRVQEIRAAFDELAPGPLGIIGKTRPECLTAELAKELRELGVVRLYVGVENTSETGAEHLARGTQTRHVHSALAACREAGIFACYNLLVFEPKTTLADVKQNVAFMREPAAPRPTPVPRCTARVPRATRSPAAGWAGTTGSRTTGPSCSSASARPPSASATSAPTASPTGRWAWATAAGSSSTSTRRRPPRRRSSRAAPRT